MSQIHEWSGVSGAGMQPNDDEIDLLEFLRAVWSRKYAIAAVTVICCLSALASSYLFKRKYESELVFVTMTDDAMGDRAGALGSLASQFGGLAALSGISLSGNERKAEYLAILESQVLIERFITENNLMPVLYSDKWDEVKKVWTDMDPKKRPTVWKAMRYFKSKIMRLKTDSKSGISRLSISWSDADIGARWANGLVKMANEHLRARTITEAERNVAYLDAQLAKTSAVAVQGSISALLENQIKRIMLARGMEQYAFRVIDPALPPEKASFPNRIVWAILGAAVGLLGSTAFVLFFRRPSRH